MKILAISLLVFASCKPIARDQQTLASDDHKVEVRLLPTESGGATLVGCSLGECHNLLKNKKGSDPYEFFKLEAVLTDIEKSRGKQSGLRKKILVGAVTVGVGVALAFGIRASALKKQIKYIDDLKGDMLKYSEAAIEDDIVKQNEYAEKIFNSYIFIGDSGTTRAAKRELRQEKRELRRFLDDDLSSSSIEYRQASDFVENIPNFSKQDADKLREALYQVAIKENTMLGVSNLEELFGSKGFSVDKAHFVIVASLITVSSVTAGHFWQEMSDNKKLKAQSRNILTLFSERTPITLSNDELKQLLKVISKYLPAKIDKKGFRQLS